MVLTTQEHKKRKAECLEIVETVTALCLLELLGIADFDEDELTYVVGLGMHALGTMSQVPRNLTPINPFHSKDDLQFEFAFRFTKQEVHRLLPCLHITPVVTVQKVGLVDGYIFLLVLLHRLHNPVTYIDMEETFGLPWYTLARIYGEAVDHVYELFIFRLLFDVVLLQMYAPKYADAITRKSGGAVTRCIGFLDGTIRQQCRPVRGQRAIFSGHKRYHGLKFQALTVPDGLIAAMFGPVEGRLHDSTMLGLSNLMFMIRTFLPGWHIYGDGAYPLRPELLKPYIGPNITPAQAAWNTAMSGVRISVEWGFSLVSKIWGYVNFTPRQQVLKSQSAKSYIVAAILTNLHNCCRPNEVSQYFHVAPPTLEQYCGVQNL